MAVLYTVLVTGLSALFWRIRGGLWKQYIPMNKIWYAVLFAIYSYFYFNIGFEWQTGIIGFLTAYSSYQAFGWGLYLGRLLSGGELKPNLAQYQENELIDDLLYSLHITVEGKKVYLYQYPRLFGFLGTCLTGLIITFLWGLFLNNLLVMVSGVSMGVWYWIGGKLEHILPLDKNGWNWGEIIFGSYLGLVSSYVLIWQGF